MKILVLKEDNIISYKLPNMSKGNLWITDFDEYDIEKNIVNIESKEEGIWNILSNNDYFLIQNSKRVNSLPLKEYSFYFVKSSSSDKFYTLYCMPNYDNNFKYYSVASNLVIGIKIGKSSNCEIRYNSSYISDEAAVIKMENEKVYIESRDTIYINNVACKKSEISYGDTIFIMGLEIVMVKMKGLQYFAINNPNNLVSTFFKEETINNNPELEKYDEPIEEKEINLYNENDYFYRKPRFIYSIKEYELELAPPPSKMEKDEMPSILTIGPMLTMSLTSVVTVSQTINSVQNKSQTWDEAIPSLIISGAMILTLLLWPILNDMFQKYINKKKEKKRQKKYSEYLEKQKELIQNEKKNQENILRKSYLSLTECANVIISKDDRLWERRILDEDFLTVSLGYGNLPMKIKVMYSQEKFSMIEDNLKDKVEELNNSEKILQNVPIPFSLSENYITAIVGQKKYRYILLNNILFQLLTFHSYDNLKIIIFSSKNKIYNFDKFRTLPHFFSNDKTIRFIADKGDEYKEIVYYLEKELNTRKNLVKDKSDAYNFEQKYLIVTDSFNSIRNIDFIKDIVSSKVNLGFSLLIVNDSISNLPDQCQSFIEVSDNESKVFKNIANNKEQKFNVEISTIDFEKCFQILSNLPLKFSDSSEGVIPKKVGFLEMYEVGKVEQLNCKNRWKENAPLLNMGAIVGIGKDGEKISLDLHEKYHGPHGLIAGMTGSGKSEFIITYILSMAINYHPYEVQFILIDYKGGGLAGAFENTVLGYKLPHLVGVITNLDKSEINRSFASIESELKRRQSLFNKAREKSGESTIDIYKYQKLYRDGVVDEPVAHLLIIADEFAELKNQQPEFMDQLISTARIGRSLGVHLILATQKPSGIVDAQIWSNTRFRVCLRVQETGDSSEVIKRPDAAYLTQTGRFYLQVGYNEIFTLGQSAWAGGKYIPSETIKKTLDTSVNFINNIGYVIKNVETKEKVVVNDSNGEELINIVKYLCDSAKEEQIECKPLWLNSINKFILVTDLIKKYNYQKESYILNPVIGEYDIPSMQKQNLLTIPFTNEGNVLLYGMAGSGKENFITTMIYSSMLFYSPAEVNYYIIDFGAEVLRYFSKSDLVGDILTISDSEKICNLFKMISDTIIERKKLFSDYNGDYLLYCKNSGNTISNIVVIINNYEAFIETYPDYYDLLVILTRDCTKYGIFFMLTINNAEGVRFKLSQNFNQNFVLQQTNEDDYSQILGNVNKTYPSKYFGRGLIKKDDIYEFQTAYISEKEDIVTTLNNINESMIKRYGIVTRKVKILPETVIYDELEKEENNKTIIGIDKNTLKNCIYDFQSDYINIISGTDFSLFETFINPVLYQFSMSNNILNIIINAENIYIDDEIKQKSTYFESNFDNIFNAIMEFLKNSMDLYIKNNKDKNIFRNKKKIMCTIIGIDSFKEKLSDDNQINFEELFTLCNKLEIINYIFVEVESKLSSTTYEDWFKENHNNSDFIWIGRGIDDQYSLTVNSTIPELKDEIPDSFCFVVRKGKPEYIKFIEKIHD